ncbi:(Fe-S)-binding protein [uncultured Microbulbifer sp.]|uniref:(Fe-S)-binding protein n=1 Tax=uncultured Microbulbifer sp. TaxID=348147 RepID=UPI0026184890|nr:(Fe-S)-binding protein [uncultured Microbulbifer sp.]
MQTAIKHYPSKPKKVYLYATCLVDNFAPQSGLDAIALLEREGIEIIYPQGQTCCGQPAYNSGYAEQAQQVAIHQIAQFPQPWPIVVLSGSCGGMLRKHYPTLLPDSPEVAAFSERIYEFSEFLVHVLKIKLEDNGHPERVALHTSCAGRREMGIREPGVQLLHQLNNVMLVEQAYESECCGFGGSFSVKHADISSAMLEDKTRHLREADIDLYVSADWGCMLNLNGAFEHQQQTLRGIHLASYLLQRTQAEPEPIDNA